MEFFQILIGIGLLALVVFLLVGLVRDVRVAIRKRKNRKNQANVESSNEINKGGDDH